MKTKIKPLKPKKIDNFDVRDVFTVKDLETYDRLVPNNLKSFTCDSNSIYRDIKDQIRRYSENQMALARLQDILEKKAGIIKDSVLIEDEEEEEDEGYQDY